MRHVWCSLVEVDNAKGKVASKDRGELELAARGSRFVRAHDDGEEDGDQSAIRLCQCTIEWADGSARVRREDGARVSVPRASLSGANPLDREGSDDAASLSCLNEPSLLALVRTRYAERRVYSRAGRVLVALNPYERDAAFLEATYGEEAMAAFEKSSLLDTPPHVYGARAAPPSERK